MCPPGLMSSNVSESLYVWGQLTVVQDESSNSASFAAGTSCFRNFQFALKLSLILGEGLSAARHQRGADDARTRAATTARRGMRRVTAAPDATIARPTSPLRERTRSRDS